MSTRTAEKDLNICLIRCHLAMTSIPASKHKAKNIVSQTSPNAICAYVCKNTKVGEPSARKSVKKYSHQITIRIDHNLYLLRIIFLEDLLRRATIPL